MFHPPTLLDLRQEQPKTRPVYDNPPVIVRHRPVRAFVLRLAAGRNGAKRRPPQPCPEPCPDSSL